MQDTAPNRASVLAAFLAVYFIWGSTYLGIRFAIETIPPFTMAAIRFLTAGALLFAWCRLRGVKPPTWVHWRSALVVGSLLMGTNGMLSWGEQYVASGTAALIIATVPLWMVVIDALRTGGSRPTPNVVAGLVVGSFGIFTLVGPADLGGEAVDLIPALVLALAAFGWALGSVYSKTAPATASTIQNVGMQMLLGGLLLLAVGWAFGERLDVASVSGRSAWALIYLITAGAIVGYGAYLWLLQVSSPAKVSTYAFVNPVVAVLLGWALGGEALTPRVALAGTAVVVAVVLITLQRRRL